MSHHPPSSVGRMVDPRYPSNLFILIVAPLAGLAWLIWKLASEGDWGAALIRALVAAGAAFLAWALAREFDPDRAWTAGVAAVLGAAVIGAGVPSLLVAGGVLMGSRITARTTGLAPRLMDLVVVALFAVLVGSSDHGLVAGVVLGAVLVADWWLPRSALPVSRLVGAVAIGGAIAAAALWGILAPQTGLPQGPEWAIVPVVVVGLLALGRPRRVAADGDFGGEPLSVGRVRLGRVIAVVAAGATFLWIGGPGLTSGSAVWAALAASALPTWPTNL